MEDTEQKKLLWRCRRGTKELDLILGKFVGESYMALSLDDKVSFDLLLETQDPQLTEWLCFDAEPPANLRSIVARICQSGKSNGSG